MKKLIFLILLQGCFFLSCLAAQPLSWDWAVGTGGSLYEQGANIATDSQGNQYITGLFRGTTSIGSTPFTSNGYEDIYVAKLNSSGGWLWAVRAGGTGSDYGLGIAVDGSGNVYLTGKFQNSVYFGSTLLSNSGPGYEDIFVAKLDTNGNWLWAISAGAGDSDIGQDIAVDSAGNCYITGWYTGTVAFGGTSLTSLEGIYGGSTYDIFVAKVGPTGNWLWAKSAGGQNWDHGYVLAVDGNGNVYTSGDFTGYATFGPYSLTSMGSNDSDVYIAKLDTNGTWMWAKKIARTNSWNGVFITGIAVDAGEGVILGGYYEYNAIFGTIELVTAGSYDIFIARMDKATGNWVWATRAGGSSIDQAYGIDLDSSGNIFATGYFLDSCTFGGTTLNSGGTLTSNIFVAKMSPAGNWLEATGTGGPGYVVAGDIDLDPAGNAYLIGNFQNTTAIGSTTLTSNGQEDIFVARLSPLVLNADFSSAPTSGPAPLNVQFTDLSQPGTTPIVSWLWQFGDDSEPSFQQNPSHTYTSPGDYSVVLVVTDANSEVDVETKENYILVEGGGTPLPPANLSLAMNGTDAVLAWDVVTLDTDGQPCTPDLYRVWHSPSGPDGEFQLLAQVTGTSYTHLGAGNAAQLSFYRVTAVKLDLAAATPLTPRSKP